MGKKKDVRGFKNFIHKLDSKSKELVKEPISKDERLELIERVYNLPGELDLDERIFLAQEESKRFYEKGYYCNKVPLTRDYIKYWEKQKELCYTGLLIDDKYYITGDCYWYLNFIQISWKNGKVSSPEIRDTDIWFFWLLEKADLLGKFTITGKVRQFGFSLKLLAKILKRFWFENRFIGKFSATDDGYLKSGWSTLEFYRDFLNSNTGWYRGLDPSKKFDWQQRQQMEDKTYIGNKSILKAVNTKNKASSIVSGAVDEAFLDEAGVQTNLVETLGLLVPALKEGNVVYGSVHVGGAAGNVKESKDLKEVIYNPSAYNMLELPNVWDGKPDQMVGIFVPAMYSYGNCKDEFGNSDIEAAHKALDEEEKKEKKKSYSAYQIFKAQYPRTLKDMFLVREENIFPTQIIEPWFNHLEQNLKPSLVELVNTQKGVLHKLSDKYGLVEDFPIDKKKDNHGAICILEPPMRNPPFGLYYAGVDTITPIKTTSSISLQSIHIYKANHEIDGEFSKEKLVAWYTGRAEDPYETYQITLDLIEYYNARACIENNNRNFIEWLIGKRKTQYIMRKRDLPLSKDLATTGSASTSSYGMTTTTSFKQYLRSLLVEYCKEVIDVVIDDEGNSKNVYGVERITDVMVLKEMLNWSPHPNFNCDRIDSFCLAIFASRANTNRGIIVKSDDSEKKVVNYSKELRNSQLRYRGSYSLGGLFNNKLGF